MRACYLCQAHRTAKRKILRRLERILLRGFLCALCVLAVNAGQHFHREDAKDAKKTLRRLIWLRLGCSVIIHSSLVIHHSVLGGNEMRVKRHMLWIGVLAVCAMAFQVARKPAA